MRELKEYLAALDNPQNRARMAELLNWVQQEYPNLILKIMWSQPVFTDHGTYIIGFSSAKNHMAVAPERTALNKFKDQIIDAGYSLSKELMRIPWKAEFDRALLAQIIEFNIADKAGYTSFWRKSE